MKMKIILFISKILFISFISADCKISFEGKDFDLSPLVKESGDDYYVQPSHSSTKSSDKQEFYLNICKPLLQQKDSNQANASVLLKDVTGSFINIGDFNHQKLNVINGRVVLSYSQGSKCASGQSSSVISFRCDSSAGQGFPQFLYDDGCVYFFEWRSQYGCAKGQSYEDSTGGSGKGKMSTGSILFFILVMSLTAYILIGIYYRRNLGFRGVDQLPNAEFWKEQWQKLKGLFTGRSGSNVSSYTRVGGNNQVTSPIALDMESEQEDI